MHSESQAGTINAIGSPHETAAPIPVQKTGGAGEMDAEIRSHISAARNQIKHGALIVRRPSIILNNQYINTVNPKIWFKSNNNNFFSNILIGSHVSCPFSPFSPTLILAQIYRPPWIPSTCSSPAMAVVSSPAWLVRIGAGAALENLQKYSDKYEMFKIQGWA